MHDWRCQLNVAHALTADLGARDFNATTLADDALKANALVLSAVALPVLRRTENLLAEQAILLRTQRSVVDRLWLLHFAFGPVANGIRGGESNADLLKGIDVQGCHLAHLPLCLAACVFFVRPTLGSADVDTEFLGGAENVFVNLIHLDFLTITAQNLNVETE